VDLQSGTRAEVPAADVAEVLVMAIRMLGQEARKAQESGRIWILPAVGEGRRGYVGKGAGTQFTRLRNIQKKRRKKRSPKGYHT